MAPGRPAARTIGNLHRVPKVLTFRAGPPPENNQQKLVSIRILSKVMWRVSNYRHRTIKGVRFKRTSWTNVASTNDSETVDSRPVCNDHSTSSDMLRHVEPILIGKLAFLYAFDSHTHSCEARTHKKLTTVHSSSRDCTGTGTTVRS